jgi:ribulose-5-phosphate 4-epimerase/fuculose-1-phosphate aldolase
MLANHGPVVAGKGLEAAVYAVEELEETARLALLLRGLPARRLDDATNFLPPLTAYSVMRLGKVALLPYFRPGDSAVANAIKGLAGKHSAVMLANHGPVVAGKGLEAAVYAVEELEETARLALLLRGLPARGLDDVQIRDVVTHFDVEWD